MLASATLLLALARLVLVFRDNGALLARARQDAVTDALTGLGNRRALVATSTRRRARGPETGPSLLAIFDLDGFKPYNDTFGHPAGDALLARLGESSLAAAVGHGRAYRLGGDEFCVLAPLDGGRVDRAGRRRRSRR